MRQNFDTKNGAVMRVMVLPSHAFHPNAFFKACRMQGYVGTPKNANEVAPSAE